MKSNEGERSPKTLTFTYSFVTTKKKKTQTYTSVGYKVISIVFRGFKNPYKNIMLCIENCDLSPRDLCIEQ